MVDAAVKATVGPFVLFVTVRVVPQHRCAGVGVGILESRRATSKDRTHARRFEPRLELRISSTDLVTIDRSGMHWVATTAVLLSMRSPRPMLRTRRASAMPSAVAVLQLLTSPSKADAPSQMLAMLDTQAVFQLLTSPLKAFAELNTPAMVATRAVVHFARSWLKVKAVAPLKRLAMLVTLAIFQLPILQLKADAPEKACTLFNTLAVFQFEMSSLNVVLGIKIWYMVVTALVSQSAIGPYVAVAVAGSVSHSVAAVPMFASVMAVCVAMCAGTKRSSARPARRCDRHAKAELHRKRHDVP